MTTTADPGPTEQEIQGACARAKAWEQYRAEGMVVSESEEVKDVMTLYRALRAEVARREAAEKDLDRVSEVMCGKPFKDSHMDMAQYIRNAIDGRDSAEREIKRMREALAAIMERCGCTEEDEDGNPLPAHREGRPCRECLRLIMIMDPLVDGSEYDVEP